MTDGERTIPIKDENEPFDTSRMLSMSLEVYRMGEDVNFYRRLKAASDKFNLDVWINGMAQEVQKEPSARGMSVQFKNENDDIDIKTYVCGGRILVPLSTGKEDSKFPRWISWAGLDDPNHLRLGMHAQYASVKEIEEMVDSACMLQQYRWHESSDSDKYALKPDKAVHIAGFPQTGGDAMD